MTPSFIIFLVGLLYVVVIWGLSLLRREGLSAQFAYEGLCLTGIACAAVYWGSVAVQPVYFLMVLYLVTMRVRLVVELGNMISKSHRFRLALKIYRFAQRLFPDSSSLLIAQINMGAVHLQQAEFGLAIEILEKAKGHIAGHIGPKHVAGCCYNLGMAYRRTGRYADALKNFREAVEVFPTSLYGNLAEKARNATLAEAGMPASAPKKENRADFF